MAQPDLAGEMWAPDGPRRSPASVPAVTVVTATHDRDDLLFDRCVYSLARQTYRDFEHVVVRDGPPPDGRAFDAARLPPFSKYVELGRNWKYRKSAGTIPRLVGCYLARGRYVAYLDDDNEYLPDHLATLVDAIERDGADFAYSMAAIAGAGLTIGADPPRKGGIDTNLLLHRAEALKVAGWVPGDYDDDWRMVEQWVAAGCAYRFVPRVTVRYHLDVKRPVVDAP